MIPPRCDGVEELAGVEGHTVILGFHQDLAGIEAFVQRVMRGYWVECANIEDYDLLAEFATEAGLDGARVIEGAQQRATKDALAANLETALAAGVFGVPTVALGEKLYFGNDRLELLELHLNGVAPPGET